MKNTIKMRQREQQTGVIVFYSYAETDRISRDQLATHLSQLKRDGLIEEWYDQQVLAGADRAQAIDKAILSAHIILLLISADFLASDTCYLSEMQQALERHKRGGARVIPVLVRPCDWQHSPFAHLQCLPRNGKFVTIWNNRDEAFLSIAQELRRIIEKQQFPSPLLSSLQRKNRERLLKRVRNFWITGFLDQSLHQTPWLDLHLQDQLDALENPWRLQVQELDRAHPLPAGTSIVEVYDEADGELLILGEPGSGKTTLLLQLARTLLDRALADELQPIPVVFNLSSWAQKRQGSLATWLVEELDTKYKVPRQVGTGWIKTNQMLPLLDGLDEVTNGARGACVQAIIAYCRTGSPLVLCCRINEYQALSLHLPLQRAVSISPLTIEQINEYISNTEGELGGLRLALHEDMELAEWVNRPLMLNIFTLAYQGDNLVELPTGSRQQVLRAILERYIQHMLDRRGLLRRWTKE